MNHSTFYTTQYIKDNFEDVILDGMEDGLINNPEELSDLVYELMTEGTIDYKYGAAIDIAERAINQFIKEINWNNLYKSINNKLSTRNLLATV